MSIQDNISLEFFLELEMFQTKVVERKKEQNTHFMWTYGIELWGCATKSNTAVIQRYQSKLLRTITNAPWYVSNQTLHSDLHIPHVRTVFRERTATHHTTLDSHSSPLMERTAPHHTTLDSHSNPLMEPLVHPLKTGA